MSTNGKSILVKKAIKRAKEAHKGQIRSGSNTPYFKHSEQVSRLVSENGGDEVSICSAYLHDVLEDTDFCIDDFSNEIVEIVKKLTHKGKEKGAKIHSIEVLRGDKRALLIKLCDRFHNLSDNTKKRDRYFSRESVRISTNLLLTYAEEVGLHSSFVFKQLKNLLQK